MKKLFTVCMLALGMVFMSMNAHADVLWENAEGQHFDWGSTLSIDASAFASVEAGMKIVLTFVEDQAADVVEYKSNGQKLPGSRSTSLFDWMSTDVYFLTPDAAAMLREYGLELCGGNLNLTKVELLEGKALKDADIEGAKTIWTGFFWVDSWSTLEIFKEAFKAEDMTSYAGIRFYSECPDTDNLIFLLAKWDDEAGVVAKSEPAADETAASNPLKRYAGYAELDLSQVNPLTVIENVNSDRLMIQMDKQGNAAFNFTDIVLVPELTPAIEPEPVEETYYIKNNWNGGSEWTWQEMTPSNNGDEWLYEGVFGGTGVNINTVEEDATALWFPAGEPYEGRAIDGTIEAGQTVKFVYNTADQTVTATVVSTGIEDIKLDKVAHKAIVDGHIVIVREDGVFNALGTRMK